MNKAGVVTGWRTGSGKMFWELAVDDEILQKGTLPNLPRFGMQISIPDRFDTMTWYGRGPHSPAPLK
ncbi:MAG: beta-galactosidase small subunit-related protein [Planctomycetota bacterium]